MNNPERYQNLLNEYGIRLEQFGLDDVALESEYALRAVKILCDEGMPILGGDVFFKRGAKIELAYANWHADQLAGETLDAFLERSCLAASKYISNFPPRKETV